jgi:hypothetical protein
VFGIHALNDTTVLTTITPALIARPLVHSRWISRFRRVWANRVNLDGTDLLFVTDTATITCAVSVHWRTANVLVSSSPRGARDAS